MHFCLILVFSHAPSILLLFSPTQQIQLSEAPPLKEPPPQTWQKALLFLLRWISWLIKRERRVRRLRFGPLLLSIKRRSDSGARPIHKPATKHARIRHTSTLKKGKKSREKAGNRGRLLILSSSSKGEKTYGPCKVKTV